MYPLGFTFLCHYMLNGFLEGYSGTPIFFLENSLYFRRKINFKIGIFIVMLYSVMLCRSLSPLSRTQQIKPKMCCIQSDILRRYSAIASTLHQVLVRFYQIWTMDFDQGIGFEYSNFNIGYYVLHTNHTILV